MVKGKRVAARLDDSVYPEELILYFVQGEVPDCVKFGDSDVDENGYPTKDSIGGYQFKGKIKIQIVGGLRELPKDTYESIEREEVDNWIKEWRELFPVGINKIGRSYRGSPKDCLKKMKAFMKEYDFTREQIFKATENAINKASQDNYNYFPQANYFIEKNQHSMLAGYCENLDESIEGEENRKTINK